MSKRLNGFAWNLYDYSNAIVMIVFYVYFANWFVRDMGMSDLWYNMTYSAGSLLLLLTAPLYARRADVYALQITYLRRVTLLLLISFAGVMYGMIVARSALVAGIAFVFANYFYQFCYIFYNTLIVHVVSEEKRDRASGFGFMCHWLGQLSGLVISVLVTKGIITSFGITGAAAPLAPVVCIFVVLSVTSLLLYKKKEVSLSTRMSMSEYLHEWSAQYKGFKELLRIPGLGLYLLSFFLFADAIITASTNYPLFITGVFGVSETVSAYVFIGILFMSAVGAILSGQILRRIGIRRMLLVILGGFVVVLPILGVIQSFVWHIFFTMLMGLLYGSIWAVARLGVVKLCPHDQLNHAFSYYTLAERFSTLVGPLAWGVTLFALQSYGALRYRVALIVMAFFVLAGFYILSKIQELKEVKCGK